MNSRAAKIAALLFSAFLLAYVGYQSYSYFYIPYETEVVLKEQYVQSFALDGFFIRDELVLGDRPEGGASLSYQYRNAQKVAKNSVIANIYDKEEDLLSLQRIGELQQRRDSLEEAQNRETAEGLKLDLLQKQIDEYEMELVRNADENDFSSLDATCQSLMFTLNKFDSYVDKSLSFADSIAALDRQIEQLQAGVSPVRGSIRSEESGYFSNLVDGYEDRLTPDMLDELTVSDVERLVQAPSAAQSGSVGKLITDDIWYFAALLPAKEALNFQAGASVTLKFNSQSLRQVPAKVERIVTEKENPRTVLVFSCDYLDENFVAMRFEKPQVILRSYTGIVIPKEAVRMRTVTDAEGNASEVKVVYIMTGQTVNYRLLDIIYEDDSVVVSRIVTDPKLEPSYVAMYDQVIIKGKDLNEADITI